MYRDVNIALANELAMLSERIGVDFWNAREAANSQPFCHLHKPGAGVGGACIPVYPQFIIEMAQKVNSKANITETGRTINNSMPSYCVQQAKLLLISSMERKRPMAPNSEDILSDKVVALLGLAFRGDVSDTRLSPTYEIITELAKLGIKKINVHDPMVKDDDCLSALSKEREISITLTSDLHKTIEGSDLIILVTDHKEYKNISSEEVKGIPLYDGRKWLDERKLGKSAYAAIGMFYNKKN